jgi:chemotaxis protein CheD
VTLAREESIVPIPPSRISAYLHAGQVFAYAEPCEVTTVLGSCVAVLLFDPVRCAGGASHYLLPYADGEPSLRYGNVAIAALLTRMLSLGCRQRNLLAKVFGGASMLAKGTVPLGTKNVEIARRTLTRENIPIVAEDVGSDRGRKLVFHTDEGFVWVKRL